MPTEIAHLSPAELERRLTPLLEVGHAGLDELNLNADELGLLGFEVTGNRASIPTDVERLSADVVISSLSDRARSWLRDLQTLEVVGSTNTLLAERLSSSSVHGAVRIAELQVQGRGRRGRSWQSPYGQNLALSLGVRLPLQLEALSGFSLCTGLAAADALQTVGVPDVALKWPNDVLARGRKVAGILVEVFSAGAATDVIVGIGINFRIPAAARQEIDQPVVDLDEFDGNYSRNQLAGVLISSLVDFAEGFAESGFAPMRSAFDKLHHYHEQSCTLLLGEEKLTGTVRGVTPAGELEMSIAGETRVFNAGEVSLRPG
jgi:BirA family biotin operon repressor/biotin-[acetyl-CoA-carboxylase] ligase